MRLLDKFKAFLATPAYIIDLLLSFFPDDDSFTWRTYVKYYLPLIPVLAGIVMLLVGNSLLISSLTVVISLLVFALPVGLAFAWYLIRSKGES